MNRRLSGLQMALSRPSLALYRRSSRLHLVAPATRPRHRRSTASWDAESQSRSGVDVGRVKGDGRGFRGGYLPADDGTRLYPRYLFHCPQVWPSQRLRLSTTKARSPVLRRSPKESLPPLSVYRAHCDGPGLRSCSQAAGVGIWKFIYKQTRTSLPVYLYTNKCAAPA